MMRLDSARVLGVGGGDRRASKKFKKIPRFLPLHHHHATLPIQNPNMAKRPADSEQEQEAFKNGNRPMDIDKDEVGDFEDEFEDEFESEDEIFEAGVDGRPDEEREAEERERTSGSSYIVSIC
jgi:hypothetical protein